MKVVITGEPVGCDDSTIILMNHRTRFDWLYIFSYILRHGPLRRFKISMKDILKNVPGPGNALYNIDYLYSLNLSYDEYLGSFLTDAG